MDTATVLPHVNAVLNSISTVLLLIGFVMIKTGRRELHRKVMLAATAVSAVFLVCYLVYHFTAPIFVFPGQGWERPAYFTLLVSHVILAAAMTPMVVVTLWRAWKAWQTTGDLFAPGAFAAHRKIARYTWPVWIYVTVTGVLIYVILYHVYPAPV
jgi:putative membrane protein